jgi:hypothetical protein
VSVGLSSKQKRKDKPTDGRTENSIIIGRHLTTDYGRTTEKSVKEVFLQKRAKNIKQMCGIIFVFPLLSSTGGLAGSEHVWVNFI